MHPASHRSLHCQVSKLQQGGSSDQELQKQRTSHGKQPAISVLEIMDREIKQLVEDDPYSSKLDGTSDFTWECVESYSC
ncbi:hypothetical protein Tco_1090653 [Tanacetum coccineum]|uniref:Uncharacterized protein n=1 Tax=Tanacetum coccineum TaxID=301880 RepID=A0ABQ5I4W2_9ASTR